MKNYLKCLFIVFFTIGVSAQSLPDFSFVTVTGTAQKSFPPDEVEISFKILAFHQGADQAMRIVSKRGADVIELAKKFNIDKNNISSYSINKNTKRGRKQGTGNQQVAIIGYDIQQSFKIKMEDIVHYPELVDALLSMSNVTNINSKFDISNKKQILYDLVIEASADAKRRADNLANGLHVRVVSVHSISEDRDINHYLAKFGIGTERHIDNVRAHSGFASNFFVPKTIDLKKTVNVIFKISPHK